MIDPTAAQAVRSLKRELIEQVAVRRGIFWEKVDKIRIRWDIDAPPQHPPPPPENHKFLRPQHLLALKQPTDEGFSDWSRDRVLWRRDIERLKLCLQRMAPDASRIQVEWGLFLSALVLYQPPLDRLHELVEYGGITFKKAFAPNKRNATTSSGQVFAETLITRLADPVAVQTMWIAHYEKLLEKLDERLKPRGLDIREMRAELEPELWDELEEEQKRLPCETYVRVPDSKLITNTMIERAASLASDRREKQAPKGGPREASQRSRLTAIELAYRKDQLGQDFLKLDSQRYPKIESPYTYDIYVREGRKIIEGRV